MPANPELGYNPTEEVVGSGTEVSNENAEALVSPEQIGNEPLPENIIAQAISQVEKISNENNEKIKKVNETMELNEKRTQDDLDTLNELVEMGISSPKTKSKVMERFNSTNTSCLAEISNVKEVAKEQLATVLQEIKNIDISQVTAELKSAIDKINKTAENWGVTNLGPEASNNNTETSADNGFVIGESAIGVPGGEVTMDNKEAAAKVAPEASNDNKERNNVERQVAEKAVNETLSFIESSRMMTLHEEDTLDGDRGKQRNGVEFTNRSIPQLDLLMQDIAKIYVNSNKYKISPDNFKLISDKLSKIAPEFFKKLKEDDKTKGIYIDGVSEDRRDQWNSKYKEVFGKLKTLESSLKDDTSLDQLKQAA